MFKKSLCLLLALLMIFPLFVACSKDGKEIDIVADGTSAYTIIYPEDAEEEENAAALALMTAIKDKTGVTLQCKEDLTGGGDNQPETAKEILVGYTNRLESADAFKTLRAKDFVIKYANERVVILGGSAEATARAVEHFIATYINSEEQTVSVYEKRNDLVEHAYLLGDLSIDGVALSDYTIVYPAGANTSTGVELLTYYTAVALADYILNNAGIEVKIAADTAKETEYEILVGNTSRQASKDVASTTLAADEYLLMKSGTKIVMLGNSYMVAGGASALVNTYFKSQGANVAIDATGIPTTATPAKFTFQKATSAILMIGDGMGNNHINATLESGTLDAFVARELPHQTFCTTSSLTVNLNDNKNTNDYTDSAAAATALATGYKTYNGYIGLDGNETSRQNVREVAHTSGARTGVLTTDVITGATPAGFLCHSNSRNSTDELQDQIDALVDSDLIDYCQGSVSTLADPAREALGTLAADGSNYFIMIEEAHIDKRAHNANMQAVQDCVVRYNQCIAYAIAFTMLHPYTALIITADHETGGLVKEANGSWSFTQYIPKSDGSDYWQHTDAKAPAFGLGDGVTDLLNANTVIDNTQIAKHIAGIFGATTFGQ